MVRSVYTGLMLAALTAVAGCQRQPSFHFAPVEGTVTKGGKPLTGVIVVFWSDAGGHTTGPCSAGLTDAAGHYRLHTEQGDDGAVVGRHRVCIVESAILLGRLRGRNSVRNHAQKELASSTSAKVPPCYARFDETPLRAEVGREPLVFDIVIP